MIYIFLGIIAIILYKIYRKLNVKVLTDEERNALDLDFIENRKSYVLNKLENSHLKGYLDTEKAFFDSGENNFIRLIERYKYDQVVLAQIYKDWEVYLDSVSDFITESELHDLSYVGDEGLQHMENQRTIFIKINEINKRLQKLLGEDFLDYRTLLYPHLTMKQIEELKL